MHRWPAAEEVMQDAFAGVHRRRAAVANPEGYLQRSVVNLSIQVQPYSNGTTRHLVRK